MLHARVVRPPALGAEVVAIDENSVKRLPGVRIVRMRDFVAVASHDEWAAIRAARELKVRWTSKPSLTGHTEVVKWAKAGPFVAEETLVNKGDAKALEALPADPQKLTAAYYWPVQSHASMGPSCAVADVTDAGATIWTASQASHRVAVSCAAALGLEAGKVRAVYLDGAGCYGMNGHDDASVEAAMISKTLGKPVRVRWSCQGMCKSGGVRVCYYARTRAGRILMLTIYAKAVMDAIPGHVLKALKEEIEHGEDD